MNELLNLKQKNYDNIHGFTIDKKNVTDPDKISNEFCKYFTDIGKILGGNIEQSR